MLCDMLTLVTVAEILMNCFDSEKIRPSIAIGYKRIPSGLNKDILQLL